MKPKKPFMISREHLPNTSGNDYALFRKGIFIKWVDWDGTKFATKEQAQESLNDFKLDARVVEILDEIRMRS